MPDLRASENDLARILHRLERAASFADIMAESARGQSLRLDRRSTSPSSQPFFRGAAVRAWAGTRWVEAATTDLTAAGLDAAAESVERAVKASPARTPPPGPSSTTVAERMTDPPHPLSDLGMEGMIHLARTSSGGRARSPPSRIRS